MSPIPKIRMENKLREMWFFSLQYLNQIEDLDAHTVPA